MKIDEMDIIIKDRFEDHQIQKTIAEIFSLSEHQVSVSSLDISEKVEDSVEIFCTAEKIEGDYNILLSIYIKNAQIQLDERSVAEKICSSFQTECLIPNDSLDPFTMLKITPNRIWQNVSLDPEELENNVYRIYKI